MREVPLLIGNADVWAADGRIFDRKNPMTASVVSRAAAAQIEDSRMAVEAAAAAFLGWSEASPRTRQSVLMRAADLLEAREVEFQEVMQAETGCTAAWVSSNVLLGAAMLREAGTLATQLNGEVIQANQPNCLALAIRQPVGVVLGIAPWNAPIALGVRAVASAIACGNTVILKSSEFCPATHRLIGEVLREAQLPDGVCNILSNAPEDSASVVEFLIGHPAVRRVNFTGSTRVGRIIAEACGRQLKPALLELGGKAPLIVLEDADIDAAINAAVFGAFNNQGQICMSTERIVVDASIADEFVDRLCAYAGTIPAGDPRSKGTVLGSLIGEEAVVRSRDLIDDAVAHGATVAVGGEFEGTVMSATVIDHVKPSMAIYYEETFAPVVSIIRADGEEDAISIANDTEYGLVASVFTRDIGRGYEIARRLQTGICHVNSGTVYNEPQMPFGGTKASGYGRFGGRSVIDEFTELRWVTLQTAPRQYPSLRGSVS